ncbi:VOC family protein [Solimonas marina]|uniref:VOC family protein n=1 Tax=Solimonas marina TaxID=2714601 RepID=A0A969WC49_9GAMM|nr:VOC family protein [Solimonas marina]NKF23395.1 VOC family protein [Solimonas marina]
MILGLRTAIYPSPDLDAARVFYTKLLGVEPYYDQPYYVGFACGGFELGLVPDLVPSADGSKAYWGCADIEAELARVLALGAQPCDAVRDVGDGIRVASVLDPNGNRFGLIQNPHFNPKAVR